MKVTKREKEDRLLGEYGWVALRGMDELEVARAKRIISGKVGTCKTSAARAIRQKALRDIRRYLLTEAK